jgi:hypothetical protein
MSELESKVGILITAVSFRAGTWRMAWDTANGGHSLKCTEEAAPELPDAIYELREWFSSPLCVSKEWLNQGFFIRGLALNRDDTEDIKCAVKWVKKSGNYESSGCTTLTLDARDLERVLNAAADYIGGKRAQMELGETAE